MTTPYHQAADAFRDAIMARLDDALQNAAGDLRSFGVQVASTAALLAVSDMSEDERRAGKAELLAQLRALAEAHRIEATRAAWAVAEEALRQVIELGVTVGVTAARAALARHGGVA